MPADDNAPADIWRRADRSLRGFFIVSDLSVGGVSLRPVFIGALNSNRKPAMVRNHSGPFPYGAELRAGTFLFTVAGEVAGIAVPHENSLAIVPAVKY